MPPVIGHIYHICVIYCGVRVGFAGMAHPSAGGVGMWGRHVGSAYSAIAHGDMMVRRFYAVGPIIRQFCEYHPYLE